MPDTVAILLAAGESRRMGRLKAQLPWQGNTLLGHQISVLRQAGVDRVVVVLGHRAEELIPVVNEWKGVSWVLNPNYAQGKTTSIKAGLKALGPDNLDAVLILSVDQPRSPGTIRSLIEKHREKAGLITIPAYNGKGGHPIVFSPALMEELGSVSEETLGIKAVARNHPDATHRVDLGTAEVLWDLNTPGDYEEAAASDG